MNLTYKQRKFCEEFLIDLNATQAAIRAGYSEKTANEQAARMLTKTNIQEYIKELQRDRSERTQITADMVVKELAKIGFMTIDQVFDDSGGVKKPTDLNERAKAAISSVKITERQTLGKNKIDGVAEKTTEVKLWDKGKALVELGRHLGIFEKDNKQKRSEFLEWVNSLDEEEGEE